MTTVLPAGNVHSMFTAREFALFVAVTASVAGATANKGRSDKRGHAHHAQDIAMHHVREYRTRVKTHRLIKRRARLRGRRIRSRRNSR